MGDTTGKSAAEALTVLRTLLAGQRLAVLATQGPEYPYTSLVAVHADDELRHVFFTTARATRKFDFLTAEPRVSLLVDSRSDDDLDFHGAVAATAVGAARELEGDERDAPLAAFVARHPQLRGFASDPSSALVEIAVETWYVVSRFQDVTELRME
jgi:nitroimidazol reductase NimA-like FMN-containing flavoprotein (pyridoxamine 5'-phosphate oxidase superfamily)